MPNTKNTVTSNFLWRFFERCGAQLVGFIVSLILARILEPSLYGTVALINVFTAILNVFIDSGLGSALIQKKDSDDLDFNSVFYFNFLISIILYFIMFLAAPAIASFYENENLILIIRVQSTCLLISGVKNIQTAYVSKKLIFKKFFFATLSGTIIAAIIGIILAIKGLGVWALVLQGLINSLMDTIILWFTVKWRPKLQFSFKRLKQLLNFGIKLLFSALLDTTYNKLRDLIIGKKFSATDLSYYSKGSHFPSFIVSNINSSINSVLLPAMSQEQDNIERVKQMTRKSIQIATYIMMPMMMGLAICAEPIIKILLTDKWLPSVFYLRIFCFTYAFYPIHTANLNAINALGRSDIFFKLEIIKKLVGVVSILITMWISVKALALSLLFTSIISQIVNSWPNKKLLHYNYFEQLKDILPQIILSILMGGLIIPFNFFIINDYLCLIIEILLGIIIYIVGSLLFKINSFYFLIEIVKGLINRHN